jgi:hypothetical protein
VRLIIEPGDGGQDFDRARIESLEIVSPFAREWQSPPVAFGKQP